MGKPAPPQLRQVRRGWIAVTQWLEEYSLEKRWTMISLVLDSWLQNNCWSQILEFAIEKSVPQALQVLELEFELEPPLWFELRFAPELAAVSLIGRFAVSAIQSVDWHRRLVLEPA